MYTRTELNHRMLSVTLPFKCPDCGFETKFKSSAMLHARLCSNGAEPIVGIPLEIDGRGNLIDPDKGATYTFPSRSL